MKIRLAGCVVWSLMTAISGLAETAEVGIGGKLELSTLGLKLAPQAANQNWSAFASGMSGWTRGEDGRYAYKIAPPWFNGAKLEGTVKYTKIEGAVEVSHALTPTADLKLAMLAYCCSFPFKGYLNGRIVLDGREVLLSKHSGDCIANTKVKKLQLFDDAGKLAVQFEFPTAQYIYVQDNRRWQTNNFSFRFYFNGEVTDKTYRKDSPYSITLRIRTAEPLKLKHFTPVKIMPGKDWIPVKTAIDIKPGSALDFSSIAMRGTDAPAGRHGRVIAKGQNFEFEDLPGVPQRFYGVNLVFSANTVERDSAQAIARHLARMGYNAVRIHHHETILLKKGSPDGLELDSEKMRQFDGLIAACIENGLYLTTDLFVSRSPIPYRLIGIDLDGNVKMDEFKELVQIHEGAYQNFLEFSRRFLGHKNAYTGRSLAEEPAMGWISLVNEGTLGNFGMKWMEKHEAISRPLWEKWLAEKKSADPAAFAAVTTAFPKSKSNRSDPQTVAFTLFLQDLETRFAKRTTAFLRDEMKCKALITNMNCWHYPAATHLPRVQCYDYVDDHFYVDHPQFLETAWKLPSYCPNRNPMAGENMGAQALVFRRALERPFTVSEYNYSAPGRFRGVGGIALGATGALQNWAGLWRFAWSHDSVGMTHLPSKAMGYFDMAGDPLGLAAERASICLFLRRDLPELKTTYAAVFPPAKLAAMGKTSPMNHVSWTWASWYAKIGSVVADAAPEGAKVAGYFPEVLNKTTDAVRRDLFGVANDTAMPVAGDGAVMIDSATGSFTLKTPRTAGGFAESGVIDADTLTARLVDSFATVWASSLDGQPIAKSRRILLTHLTDVQNTRTSYADSARTILLNWGGLPHVMSNGGAEIALTVANENWKVYVLATDGTRRAEIPTKYCDGRLRFIVRVDRDPKEASYLYEVVAE